MSEPPKVETLVGHDVLAVGRRQAWLFVTFASPVPARTETTLWIDTAFRIGGEQLSPISDALAHLEPLVTSHVVEARADDDGLHLRFDQAPPLDVSATADHPESGVWWLVSDE